MMAALKKWKGCIYILPVSKQTHSLSSQLQHQKYIQENFNTEFNRIELGEN